MKIVLGLGNPGERYRWTRHNLGFRVIDCLAERRNGILRRGEGLGRVAWTAEIPIDRGEAILAKPRTYMNRSGRAAVALLEHFDTAPEELIVVYDDADLDLGRVRVRPAGRAGGHNGVRSLIDALRSENFPRVRLGVRAEGREDGELADYVLEEFEPDEVPVSNRLVEVGADAVESVLNDGVEAAMNAYNGVSVAEE